MNHTVVLFLANTARIIKTTDVGPYKGIPGVLIDPDLSLVAGHPPHYWKNEQGKVIPISNEEKIKRDELGPFLHWDHAAVVALLKQAKVELRNRQILYAAVAALMVAVPFGLFLFVR